MSLPFDATLKDLVQSYLPDYERQLDLTRFAPLRPLNVDLSTVSAATDIVLAHGEPPEVIVDLNFQASRAEDLAPRMLLYNTLLHYRFRVPVHSLVVLLRPAADDREVTGKVSYQAAAKGKLAFRYEAIRLWRWPAERFLTSGLGTLPLAVLGRFPANQPLESGLADVVERILGRLSREASPSGAAKLLTASYVLSGLRMARSAAKRVFEGVRAMQESTTYQGIIEEGQIKEARRIILRLGRKRFGKPRAAVQAALDAVSDLNKLERMIDRLVAAENWQDLIEID